jgi:quercetin dioxygenase-like cupin family protein/alkylhydroperoxidase/carboxymuconolactone decarboxylase family protein YurZ
MRQNTIKRIIGICIAICCLSLHLDAQNEKTPNQQLTAKQQSIVQITALTAKGELQALKPALNKGLDAGLTINEIKEVLVHLYAYCGFPRSIRGLQTFMEVLDERKTKGIIDKTGAEASPINQEKSKYERGKKVLGELTKAPQDRPLSGYSVFAPAIDTFLKEHLFADIFERDVLTYAERELVTISVISAIGGAEPMLRSHLSICMNVGLTPAQLTEFVEILQSTIGEKEAKDAQAVLNEILKIEAISQKGERITSNNFSGTVYLKMMGANDTTLHTSFGNVTFEPKARTNWHSHPGGQLLFVTDGRGYYQAKGQPARLLRKGDSVEIPRNVVHWHGAAPDSEFAHLAVSLNTDDGGAIWSGPVTDDEYGQATKFEK